MTTRLMHHATIVHAGLVAAAVYYVIRVANFTPLADLPNTDMVVFSATALPPVLAAIIGRLVFRERAQRMLGYGLALGAIIFAASLIGVIMTGEHEPLAPLWLILVSLWLAAGYAVLLLAVWIWQRFGASRT